MNDRNINAPISKIVEAINQGIIDGDIVFVDQYTRLRFGRMLKDKLASLGGEEKNEMPIETELKISEDIDAILIKIHNEGYTGSNEHDLHIREEIVDYIKKVSQPHPSEREVLMRFASHLNTYNGLEEIRFDFMVIDYINRLAEKGGEG